VKVLGYLGGNLCSNLMDGIFRQWKEEHNHIKCGWCMLIGINEQRGKSVDFSIS
jgi:hypothetical protein